jgi:ParB family transcriptional regulator, chromosome partitioning protein
MKSVPQNTSSQFIALSKLKKSPNNVRQTPHTNTHIEALADSIAAHGQIQNLVVETETDAKGKATGHYLVTAGEGRRLAQLLRVKRKEIKADEPIHCVIDDAHRAQAISLAENELHEHMHPADQFAAFKQLVDGGQSIEEVAAHFGVTPLVVQRRLKLANVAPEFLILYRENKVSLDHLMALALSDDHAKQKSVWESLPKYDRQPHTIRHALTETELPLSDAIVKFVGVKAYEKAGGLVRRDLFAECTDEGFVLDPDLLRRLATEKLGKQAERVKAEGFAWVEIVPQLDYAGLSAYRRVREIARAPTEKEQAALDVLLKQHEEIEKKVQAAEGDEDRLAELGEHVETIEAQLEEAREKLMVPDAAQQALAGAIVSISHNGSVRIERGLLKPEDAKRFAREGKEAQESSAPKGPRVHSAALLRRLTAHRTKALQVAIAQRPDIAIVTLTHRLVLRVFFEFAVTASSVAQIDAKETVLDQYAPDLAACKAHGVLAERAATLRAVLPEDPTTLFAWLLQQPLPEVMSLCAYCVALSLNGVSAEESNSATDALAAAAGLDMRQWWAPTVQNYLGSVSRAQILEAVREAVSPEAAATLTGLKKSPLAEAAEKRLAGTGWLPRPLRVHVA